jgi:hypothetical protein
MARLSDQEVLTLINTTPFTMAFIVKSAPSNCLRKAKSSHDCAPILYIVCRWPSETRSRPTSAVCARPQTGYLEDSPEALRGSHFTVRVADVVCCVPFEVPISVTV